MTSDKTLIKRRFESQFSRYDRLALVQHQICDQLSEIVFRVCTSPVNRALEVGIGTGFLTRLMLKKYPKAQWFLNDIADGTQLFVDKYVTTNSVEYIWGDAENILFADRLDLITSASTVQWFDDLPEFIRKCSSITTSGGYLAITTFGKQNFKQIKSVTDQGLDYYSVEELISILNQHGFDIEESLEYIKDMTFDTPTEVLRHIKATGVNSLKTPHWTKNSLAKFDSDYRKLCPNKITLTYHPIIIVAKRV